MYQFHSVASQRNRDCVRMYIFTIYNLLTVLQHARKPAASILQDQQTLTTGFVQLHFVKIKYKISLSHLATKLSYYIIFIS